MISTTIGGMDDETVAPRCSRKTRTHVIKPLGLSDDEKADLVAFLEAFSGEEMIIEKPVLPEYQPLFTEAELKEVKKMSKDYINCQCPRGAHSGECDTPESHNSCMMNRREFMLFGFDCHCGKPIPSA